MFKKIIAVLLILIVMMRAAIAFNEKPDIDYKEGTIISLDTGINVEIVKAGVVSEIEAQSGYYEKKLIENDYVEVVLKVHSIYMDQYNFDIGRLPWIIKGEGIDNPTEIINEIGYKFLLKSKGMNAHPSINYDEDQSNLIHLYTEVPNGSKMSEISVWFGRNVEYNIKLPIDNVEYKTYYVNDTIETGTYKLKVSDIYLTKELSGAENDYYPSLKASEKDSNLYVLEIDFENKSIEDIELNKVMEVLGYNFDEYTDFRWYSQDETETVISQNNQVSKMSSKKLYYVALVDTDKKVERLKTIINGELYYIVEE